MNTRSKRVLQTFLRFLPLIICAVFILVFLMNHANISAETLLNYAPEKPVLAVAFLIMLYALKSLSIFFPFIILNIVGGFLFPPGVAILVNSIGLLVELVIPYGIGRLSGHELADKLGQKHKRIAEIADYLQGNTFFISFFLRVISCLPGDAVSMYLGANKISFGPYMIGSFLGTFPGLLFATLLGTSITDPSSPMFWISAGSIVVLSICSFLIFFLWKKLKKK